MPTALDEMLSQTELACILDLALADAEGWIPARFAEEFSPTTHDFVWSADYASFRVIRLRWWDDASYIAYQSDCE